MSGSPRPTAASPVRAVLATMRAALADASSNRAALAFQMIVMVINDLVWVGFWALFFRSAGSVRGWEFSEVIVLQAVLTTAGGITLGLLSNARHLGSLIVDVRLDAVLALPVSPLAHVLVRRIEPTNLGDVVFGIGIFAIAGNPTPARVATFVIVCALATILLTSFLVTVGSLAFFSGKREAAELGFQAMLLLGNYPLDIFSGRWKLIVSTVVPALFVATVPARLVASYSPATAAAFVAVTALFVALAGTTFHIGLRRYTSGAIWTRA